MKLGPRYIAMSERKKGARFRSTWLSLPLQACKEAGEMTDAIMRLISVDYSRVNSLTFQFCFFHDRRNEVSDLLVFNVACAVQCSRSLRFSQLRVC